MITLAYFPFDDVGKINDVAAIAVDDVGAISYTVTTGKKGVILQNVGAKMCWFGGDTVNPATKRGITLLPNTVIVFRNVRSTFKVYFKCGAGDTTTIGIVEYD